MGPAMTNRRCTWVGWPGDPDPAEPFDRDGIHYVPVVIDEQEIEDYYEGFSNGTLWPLYHDAVRPPQFRPSWWKAYEAINQRFADVVARPQPEHAMVWVHDYQLQLVPAMLRDFVPTCGSGSSCIFRFLRRSCSCSCPGASRLSKGYSAPMWSGFQVPIAARNFAVLARRLTTAQGRTSPLMYQGRNVRIGAYPISIDVQQFEDIGRRPETIGRAKEIRESLGAQRFSSLGWIALTIRRALRRVSTPTRSCWRRDSSRYPTQSMVQIAVPTRSNVPAYIDQRNEIERLIGELNGDFGRMGAPAVHYLHQNLGSGGACCPLCGG